MIFNEQLSPKILNHLKSLKWKIILPNSEIDDIIMNAIDQKYGYTYTLYGIYKYGTTEKTLNNNFTGKSRLRDLKLKVMKKTESEPSQSIMIISDDLKDLYDHIWSVEDKTQNKLLKEFLNIG